MRNVSDLAPCCWPKLAFISWRQAVTVHRNAFAQDIGIDHLGTGTVTGAEPDARAPP